MEGAQWAVLPVPVGNQEAAKRYYTETLKFELVREDNSDAEDRKVIHVRPAGSPIVLNLFSSMDCMNLPPGVMSPPQPVNGVVLEVANLDAAVMELRGKGVQVSEPSNYTEGKVSILNDPDANTFVLKQRSG